MQFDCNLIVTILSYHVTWIIVNQLTLTIKSISSLGADCKCITFQDTYGKEYGVFTSPNWPIPYDENINCLLYNFVARPDQIIEVTFDEFDVQRSHLACVYGDFVKLYLHLNEFAINEKTLWNQVLCGKIVDIEQTHYSSDSCLMFEFHSDWRHGNNTGFRGTYRFLDKKLFQTDGRLEENSNCDYIFESLQSTTINSNNSIQSTDLSSINNNTNVIYERITRGRFYSPQYPSTYPKGVKCSYTFIGQPSERVKLVFEHIRLQKSDSSCLNSPDVIYIHDGGNQSGPVIGQLCNTNTFVELVSTGPDLYIQFVSKSHAPGQGFKGKFFFESTYSFPGSSGQTNSLEIPSTEPEKSRDSPGGGKVESEAQSISIQSVNCDETFNSDTIKNGTFSSPNYPNPYPANVQCKYNFNGRGKERVQIMFSDFHVYKPDDSSKDCDGADVVMVFITINGQKERLDNLCGDTLPLQLMSNGPSMTVEFKSTDNFEQFRGFKADYRFVTNFGITAGIQDSQSVCGFIFRSSDRSNGSFTSPNYPGQYPRDTECHYFFFGNQSERAHITFAYFDIEGVTPCTTETASDYVEFSNYRTVDRKIPRHCGVKKPKTIESDGDFFRITFKSNDRFDGTGFEAFYQFRGPEDAFNVKQIRGLSSGINVHMKFWRNSVLSAGLTLSIMIMKLLVVL
ncbi:suppressor of lurcher protein 1-like [Panonychus citri]|uniref:suppressor of lurcher protein 1-like n=1 Tax=Panonychus citri TaxID=50023 RepID=UPI0023073DB3|nr:suppressor of lurcher protein 1-like [Panonychus citri]XP_053202837.1 suppressor of lurcher protein 1-like [Panonychus citri]XP_053202838.1 suppressor of lurcher protein 1-like [Panonychus citri]